MYLQLTVAVGAINGLIFYANIVAVNSATFFPDPGTTFSASRFFISWLNLDFGINTCFYDGMDAYAKIALQFVFPFYVWLLIGGVIVSSHYSTRASRLFGRNPVAVLSTLVLLTYTKRLRTIIAAFSFTFIDGHSEAVWLYNGNVLFLQGKHIPLFIVALLVLIVLFIPYTLYLTFGQCILAWSPKTWPFRWLSGRKTTSVPRCLSFSLPEGTPLLAGCAAPHSLLSLPSERIQRFWKPQHKPSSNYHGSTRSTCISVDKWRTIPSQGIRYSGAVLCVESWTIVSWNLSRFGDQHILFSVSVGASAAVFVCIVIFHVYRLVKGTRVIRSLMQTKEHIGRVVMGLRGERRGELPDGHNIRQVTTTFVPKPSNHAELRESLLS